MGLFSKLFGKKTHSQNIRQRPNQPDVIRVQTEDDKMNWAMEKAKLTLHYFEKSLTNPQPRQQYFSIKVKIVDGEKIEHIWLTQPSFDEEGNLFGIVGNKPIDVKNVKIDQKIEIDRALVSDWMIIENGRLIGGYTIRAIRDNLSGTELKNFDKGLGGMIVDDGEDYFLPSDVTPEGAIMLIEEAYDEDNLEKAINCKDFYAEAELMLSKMGKGDLGKEVVEKTAEVLKLSFIKSLQDSGMPKFKGIIRAFPKREKISDNHIIVTEICYYPDGGKSMQRLNTYKTEDGWKVLNPVD
ncbi:MAG: DUF2314 domain-containing protein [Sporocytophaga sp.]|uniref:YegJ family protein n=1 Tax=Sporocytophaga sp. TaxID=2231183 RepID=UPI001B135C42|nr:DUF2314 domain-containing protein [Sporocytophaga sp.]MBO9702237.1 DUF2314 domain-containing protein [Sporocytophaga sp.]